jgi:short-subunit dehydrogenase
MEKELRISNSNVHVSVVCPGLINTSIMQSSRNRNADLSHTGEFAEGAQRFRQGLTDSLAAGWPPAEVATQVFEAVKENRFYVIPAQEGFTDRIKARMEGILELRNPR